MNLDTTKSWQFKNDLTILGLNGKELNLAMNRRTNVSNAIPTKAKSSNLNAILRAPSNSKSKKDTTIILNTEKVLYRNLASPLIAFCSMARASDKLDEFGFGAKGRFIGKASS